MASQPEPTVSLSLTVKDSAKALAFYTQALGAKELYRLPAPDGGVAHAEFMLGNTRIYISDESEEWQAFAMPEGAMASCLFTVLSDDCDSAYEQALDAGAISLSAPEDKFWGARSALIKDPFGYRWCLTQMIEEISPEEMAKRAQAFFESPKK